MYAKIPYGFWKKKHRQSAPYVPYLVKKVKKLASSSNQSVKSQKQCIHPRILLLWQKMCVKRHQHQFAVVFNNWTFRRHNWNEFCIKTLIWSQLTIQCVFASLNGPEIDLQIMLHLGKKSSFDLGGYVNNQNCPFGAQKTRKHTSKTRCTQNSLFGWLGC